MEFEGNFKILLQEVSASKQPVLEKNMFQNPNPERSWVT